MDVAQWLLSRALAARHKIIYGNLPKNEWKAYITTVISQYVQQHPLTKLKNQTHQIFTWKTYSEGKFLSDGKKSYVKNSNRATLTPKYVFDSNLAQCQGIPSICHTQRYAYKKIMNKYI